MGLRTRPVRRVATPISPSPSARASSWRRSGSTCPRPRRRGDRIGCRPMPRDGAMIFSDLIGKLDTPRVECSKCEPAGRYRLADLLMRYGRNEKLFAFTVDVTVFEVTATT